MVQNLSLVHLGNIADLGIKFKVRDDADPDHKWFSSKGATEVTFHAKGEHHVKASLEINLKSADAVFFNAADCRHSLMEDKPALGRQVMKMFKKRNWRKSWAIITDIVKAGATTVAVSGGDASSLVLEGSADDAVINLEDASAQFSITSQKNVGFQVIGRKGLTPLIGLCQIQSAFLGLGKQFNPLTLSRQIDVSEAPDHTSGNDEGEDSGDVFFGQLH